MICKIFRKFSSQKMSYSTLLNLYYLTL